MPHCSAINCANGPRNGVKVHTFPRDLIRRSVWIQNCRRDSWSPTEHSVLCDSHFEESQFESNRQDGKRFLKSNAIPTLFDVPNKPKPVTLQRVNPLNRKRVVTTSMPLDVLNSNTFAKRRHTETTDHQYFKSNTVLNEFRSCGTCDHTYSAGINPETSICCEDENMNHSAVEAKSELSEPTMMTTMELTDIIELQSQPVYCANASCRNTVARLKLQIRQLQRKVYELQRKLSKQTVNLRSFLAEDQLKFLQANQASRNKGVVWSLKTIREAFQIRYICGAHGYEFIRSLHYPLPSYRTLCDRIQQASFQPGIQVDVIKWMQCKLKSTAAQERDCVLMLDELAVRKFLEYDKGLRSFVGHITEEVRKPLDGKSSGSSVLLASHALVVMIRGLTTNWKQVVAYYLTGDSVDGSVLWNLVTRIIIQLNACEVNVRAVVCDMGSCNRAMWRVAGITASQNHVVNSVKHPVLSDQQLYFLPDVPHVLKNVRNCLLSQNIVLPNDVVEQFNLPGSVVSVSHVRSLLDLQEASELKITPYLQRKHVEPKQFEKMKVSFAAQLFSHSVSSALKFCVQAKLLPVEALTTAWFLECVNQWFDVANARSKVQALHPNSVTKIAALKLMMSLAAKLSFQSCATNKVKITWKPIQTGLLMASKSLIDMHSDFVQKGYYKFLLTSRLTQDALENLFSQIRGRGDSHPTPVKFRHSLRLISISQFTKTPKNSSYDSVDDTRFAAPLIRTNRGTDELNNVQTDKDIETASFVVSAVFGSCERNALAYLAGWIAFKLKSKVSCDDCARWLVRRETDEGISVAEFAELQLTVIKSYGGSDSGLTLPSQNLLNLLFSAETVFSNCKGEFVRSTDIQLLLLQECSDLMNSSNIPDCHGLGSKILRKFFQLRLHVFCKEVSRSSNDECQHSSKSAKSRTVIK